MGDIFAPIEVPRFVSHRGYRPLAPDNSLPGFVHAGRLGQWAIETDVHVSRDGVPVCCHDATVDATYDGEGRIDEMTWAELSRLRLRTGNRVECLDDDERRMPLFTEYLAICRASGSVPFIELKMPEVEPVLRAAREVGVGAEEMVMSSFELPWLEAARALTPGLFLHHIFCDDAAQERLASLGHAGLSWNVKDPTDLSPEPVAQAHAMGLKVCLRSVDSLEQVQQILALGLDYVPTNTMHPRLHVGPPVPASPRQS
ncbi:MAG TPA: hypothetical protein IAA98_01930 [Candidatus Avipropionibacterium avicola]|uniref:GP-PDE domain-containing protein n=1 Tax=Candidatus Avipropionibacterium avicola TaxID=2840701 RepID=A0A9D1KMJ2_9ACTN|nr:hypothetical protein [Candidatus Avipropionibacterium avicola]